jgi:L-ascorbate metabolism protein UlaG (beta-lactamase superfamily)
MLSQKTPPPLLRIARNPTVDLTVSIDTILKDLDFVIVTHTHSDHFDTLASEKLPKRHQIILPTCRQRIYGKANFVNAEVKKQKQPLKILPHKNRRKTRKWRNIGTDGRVSGFVLQAENEPTLYIVGDSICGRVENAITTFKPEIIVTNCEQSFQDLKIIQF